MQLHRVFVVICTTTLIVTITSANHHERKKRWLGSDDSSISGRIAGAMEAMREWQQQVVQRVQEAMEQTQEIRSSIADQATQVREQIGDMMMSDMPASSEREIEGISSSERNEEEDFEMPVVVVEKGMPERPSVNRDWFSAGVRPDFGSFFGFQIPKPWWKGENVCPEVVKIDEGEQEEDKRSNATSIGIHTFSFHSSSCHETETSYVCQTRIRTPNENKNEIVKYQCCHGYARKGSSDGGCTELDLKDLEQTMKNLGANKMLKQLSSVGLDETLRNDNITIFSPTDEAWDDFETDNMNNEIGAEGLQVDTRSTVAGHMVLGFKRSGDFDDEEIIPTIHENVGIRMNVYHVPTKVVTANCARIVSTNNYATNGVVHMIDRVMPQPTQTVADIISTDPQFSILKEMLTKAELMETLKDPKGHLTVFAPADGVFNSDKVDPNLIKQLKEGNGCVNSILQHHILRSVVCSSAIPKTARTVNMLQEYLSLHRDGSNALFVNDVQVIGHDIVATNGVIHIIDGILLPEKAKSMSQAIKDSNMDQILDLLEGSGLLKKLDSMQNVTLFVPSKHALQALSEKALESLKKDPSTLEFHIAKGKLNAKALHNNQFLETLSSGKKIRMNVYSEFPGFTFNIMAQCARVVSWGHGVCGGMINVVDKVMTPSKGNIMKTLQDMGHFSTLLGLLNSSGLSKKLEEESGPFTLLAPTDEAFGKLPNRYMESLLKDKSKAERLMKLHILPESVCCSRVQSDSFFNWHEMRALDGTLIPTHRSVFNKIRFGRAPVSQCDVMADNGIIHVISGVLRPSSHSTPLDVMRIFF